MLLTQLEIEILTLIQQAEQDFQLTMSTMDEKEYRECLKTANQAIARVRPLMDQLSVLPSRIVTQTMLEELEK